MSQDPGCCAKVRPKGSSDFMKFRARFVCTRRFRIETIYFVYNSLKLVQVTGRPKVWLLLLGPYRIILRLFNQIHGGCAVYGVLIIVFHDDHFPPRSTRRLGSRRSMSVLARDRLYQPACSI